MEIFYLGDKQEIFGISNIKNGVIRIDWIIFSFFLS